MRVTNRLLIVLAMLSLGLMIFATPSTSEESSATTTDCFECPGDWYGDPDGGGGYTGGAGNRQAYAFRSYDGQQRRLKTLLILRTLLSLWNSRLR